MRRCRTFERRRRRSGSPAAATTPRSSSCVATCRVGTLTLSHLHTRTFSNPHTLTLSYCYTLTLSLSLTLTLAQFVLRRDLYQQAWWTHRHQDRTQDISVRHVLGAPSSVVDTHAPVSDFRAEQEEERLTRRRDHPAQLVLRRYLQEGTLTLSHVRTLTLSHSHTLIF